MDIVLDYAPHPKQQQLHASPANEILFGGSAGPGKSHALRFEGLKWALAISNLQVFLFRRTYPELEDNHIIPSQMQFPVNCGTYSEVKRRWTFFNNSMMHFCHCQHEKDVFRRQGAEIHLLLFDELTSFTEFIYDYLRARVRCPLDIPEEYRHKIPGILAGSNPGGIGHEWVKRRWVDFAEPYVIRKAPRREGGMRRQYIPGLLEDNPTLQERDPTYMDRLDALPEPYRTAYREGDWEIFLGQMFAFNRKHHVVVPRPVPDNAPLLMTFDWGFGKPYSAGWWWVDDDDRLYRFGELYGCQPGQVDVGVRQADDVIADEIIKRERELGVEGRSISRYCDPTCFNKKPDYKGGGQGPATADEFAAKGIHMRAGDPSRILKIRQFHQRLRVTLNEEGEPQEPPMLQVYDTCEAFIRTIPVLQADQNNAEDVDTKMEDHVYDEAALACMARAGLVREAEGVASWFNLKKK